MAHNQNLWPPEFPMGSPSKIFFFYRADFFSRRLPSLSRCCLYRYFVWETFCSRVISVTRTCQKSTISVISIWWSRWCFLWKTVLGGFVDNTKRYLYVKYLVFVWNIWAVWLNLQFFFFCFTSNFTTKQNLESPPYTIIFPAMSRIL